ncbi:hypothetical protein L6164_033507 [Bauhinia variegata]|uniref:Uncharacterized protein n=1 Tax=Bauhinia variegata TaxID=167791 RepID=A0ACB9KS21_BAUVA|nr:hypothetical protein L6164_033507 [Bauhinia variegata]
MGLPRQAYLWCYCWDSFLYSESIGFHYQNCKRCLGYSCPNFCPPLPWSNQAIKRPASSHLSKGSQTISKYMQAIKRLVDKLALLGKPIDPKDIIDRVVDGLDTDYQSVVNTVHARDTPISFD